MVARALHALECREDSLGAVAAWVAAAQRGFDEEEVDAPQEWTLEPPALFESPTLKAVGQWPPTTPTTEEEFIALVRALQVLDRWHRPLMEVGAPQPFQKLEAHEEARDRLRARSFFGRYRGGRIIPAAARAKRVSELIEAHLTAFDIAHARSPWRAADDRAVVRPMLLAGFMAYTAFLPATVEAQNQGKEIGAGRRVFLSYRQWRPDDRPADRPAGIPYVVGIAPMIESGDDIRFQPSEDGSSYCVELTYPAERIDKIVARAINEDVEILLLPECTVAEANLGRLREQLLLASRAFYREHRALPKLRYVFAGVAAPPRHPGGRHRNFVVLLDQYGTEIMRQRKLFPWDLYPIQVKWLGVDEIFGGPHCAADEPQVLEDIALATKVVLVDLEDMGRVLTMICADMDYNLPGDWLMQHLQIDWLHSPILDKFVAQIEPTTGEFNGTWICRRAHRAALGGHSLVMVTNSMGLTHWLKKSREDGKTDWTVDDPCGIGLLIDGTLQDPIFCHVSVPLDSPSPVLATKVWGKDWRLLREEEI